ncbi:MAG: hypothetical protein AAFP22_21525, partial [Planctomycetota bacterium]
MYTCPRPRSNSAQLALLAVAALASSSPEAAAQRTLRVDRGDPGDGFGAAVAPFRDVDGDGVCDYAASSSLSTGAYRLEVRSGATGARLLSVTDPESISQLVAVDDWTGDGVPDLLSVRPSASFGEFSMGAIDLRDGVTLDVVRSSIGNGTDASLGGSGVVVVGDADGDGVRDFIAAEQERFGISNSLVRLFSGATGVSLRTYEATAAFFLFGSTLVAPGDLDGDGVDDYGFSREGGSPQTDGIFCYSSVTGAELLVVGRPSGSNPAGAAGAPDRNGDGTPDLIVRWTAGSGPGAPPAALLVHSGVDGAVLETVPIDATRPPTLMRARGDFDGDGVDDLVLRSTLSPTSVEDSIRSGVDLREVARIPRSAPVPFARMTLGFTSGLAGATGDALLVGIPAADSGAGTVRAIGFDPGVGAPYCAPAAPNSTGSPAELRVLGSTVVSD